MALSDYTELEYIESTGSQFIGIDYIPKTLHTKYELGFMRTGTSGYWNPIINSEEDVRFGIMCTIDGSNSSNYGQFHIGPAGSGFKSVQFPISSNIRYDIIADKTGISLNGTKYSVSGVGDATGSWSTYINHRLTSSTSFSPEYSIGRWYYLKVYEDDGLIKDYIPARRKSDNVLGMYEKLGDKFYINSGTGNFIAGPIKDNIINYQKLEYIESTGTQYIDTLQKGNSNTKIELKFYNSYTSSSEKAVFGSRTYPRSNCLMIGFYSNGWVCYNNGEGAFANILNKVTDLKLVKNNMYVLNSSTQQYELVKTYNSGSFTTPSNMILFGERRGNDVTQLSSIKVYYCKIYDGDVLVRDFIPVKRKSDNVLGLFDKVNNGFYTNAGTGNFIAGPIIYDGSQLKQNLLEIQEELNTQLNNMYIAFPELNRPYIELEYIQSIDKQYIDTNTANILVDGCRIEASLSFASPTERQCIFGTEVASPFYRNYLFKTSSGFECGAYNYDNISYSVEVNQVLVIDYSTVKGNNYLKVNNSTIWSNKDNNDRASTSSYLFAFHHRFNYAQAFAKMKLYYFKMYNSNNELIRDFIPVKRKSDDEICMYDKVTNQFFTNQGAGNFIAGPEVN